MPRAAIATGMVDWVLPVAEMPAPAASLQRAARPPASCRPRTGRSRRRRPARPTTSARRRCASVLGLPARADRPRLQLLQAGDDPAPHRAPHERQRRRGPARLPGVHAHPPGRGRRAAAGPADQRHQLLSRPRGLRRARRRRSRRCSTASRRTTRCASGCRPARPARRPTRSPCCWPSTRARSRRRRRCRSSPPTSTKTRSARRARASIRSRIAADVSEERLRRFFVKEQRGYRVRGEVRETVLFAIHDLLKDAPFSRLDLFSCRNLLIYLDARGAERALEIVHFALRPGGLLFLGASETVDGSEPPVRGGRQEAPDLRAAPGRPAAPAAADRPEHPGARARAAGAQPRAAPCRRPRPAASLPGGGVAAAGRGRDRRRLLARAAPEADRATGAALGGRHRRLRDRPPLRACGPLPALFGGEPTSNLLRAVDPAARGRPAHGAAARGRRQGRGRDAADPVRRRRRRRRLVLRVAPAEDLTPGFLLVTFDLRAADGGSPPRAARRRRRARAAAAAADRRARSGTCATSPSRATPRPRS